MAPGPPRNSKPLDPFRELRRWLAAARRLGVVEPEAMALATASRGGRPSARMVLLRELSPAGLVFFTNYQSRKGRELTANPWAAVVFYWEALSRQVRVEGRVRSIPPAESDLYFATRPRGARLATWASPQSAPIRSRAWLVRRFAEVRGRHGRREVLRPPHWGGYRLVPVAFEFWRSGSHRLHHRLRYERRGRVWRAFLLGP